MSVRIQYAYLKQQTWLYRRNYPAELKPVLGQALKQSLKTGDARLAKARAAEVNIKYEEIVAKARAGVLVSKPEPVKVVPPGKDEETGVTGAVSAQPPRRCHVNATDGDGLISVVQTSGLQPLRTICCTPDRAGRRPESARAH